MKKKPKPRRWTGFALVDKGKITGRWNGPNRRYRRFNIFDKNEDLDRLDGRGEVIKVTIEEVVK